MNTNDPKAPYGDKREPLLSDGEAGQMAIDADTRRLGGIAVNDWWKAKIASGELIHVGVAKLRRVIGDDHVTPCIQCYCGMAWREVDHISCEQRRCPSCHATLIGAKIIEE